MGLVKIMIMMIIVIIRIIMMMMEIIGKYEKHKSSHGAYHFNQIDQGSECGSEKRGEWEKIIILIFKVSFALTNDH